MHIICSCVLPLTLCFVSLCEQIIPTGLLKSGDLQIKCFYIGLDFATVYITGTSSNTILSTLFYYSKTYRVMIYNGDVDSCVPYVGPAVRYRKIATVLIYIKSVTSK